MPCNIYSSTLENNQLKGDYKLKKNMMNMTTWAMVLFCILCIPTLANALERVSVPDAGIFWLLGPTMIFLGILGKKKK
jgi:hypothetical protein